MNFKDDEVNVISLAVDYFLKQSINGVPAEQKEKLNTSAIEAKNLIASKSNEIDINHIQALYAALELYSMNMKKSALVNPKILVAAEEMAHRFSDFLEPLLDDCRNTLC